MKKFLPNFKDDRDKMLMLIMTMTSVFLFFMPSCLAVIFLKDKISDSSYEIAKMFFNFELILFFISLIFVIPIIGWIFAFLLGPILMIFNVIICSLALISLTKNSEVKIPVLYQFI